MDGRIEFAECPWRVGQGCAISALAERPSAHSADVPRREAHGTGYDHLLFLVGAIFFLYRLKDILLYVSLFTVGHSLTLLGGALGGIQASAFLVDAVIGLSIVYKAFENMGGFKALGVQPNTRVAVFVFGLVHGFGLATKLQEYSLSRNGLVTNIVSFNGGVEIGQFLP